MRRLSFSFRWPSFIAIMLVTMLGIALGNWQMRRAEYKQSLQQQFIERGRLAPVQMASLPVGSHPDAFRRVIADGEFIGSWPVYLENRPLDGRAGFCLLMPFRIAANGSVVLVLRGWFPRDLRDRAKIPAIPTPAGRLSIAGRVQPHIDRVLQLGEAPSLRPAAIMQNLSVDQFATASGLPTHAFVIEQTSDTGDGLRRDWPWPSFGIEKHRSYALQWYALTAAALIFYIVTGIRDAKHDETV